jgi:hypothetical protein
MGDLLPCRPWAFPKASVRQKVAAVQGDFN